MMIINFAYSLMLLKWTCLWIYFGALSIMFILAVLYYCFLSVPVDFLADSSINNCFLWSIKKTYFWNASRAGYRSSSGTGAVILDDCNFHESVRLDSFDTDRTLSLVSTEIVLKIIKFSEYKSTLSARFLLMVVLYCQF